jgi:hypothetical protein
MVKKHHGTAVKVAAVHSIGSRIDTSVRQEQPNWCWAACLSVIVKLRLAPRTQCQIATLILPKAVTQGDCCTFASSSCFAAPNGSVPSSPCDQGIGAGPFLAWLVTQMFSPVKTTTALTNAKVVAQMTAKSLVAVFVVNGGQGHIRLVYGMTGAKFNVFDPCYGISTETLAALTTFPPGYVYQSALEDL